MPAGTELANVVTTNKVIHGRIWRTCGEKQRVVFNELYTRNKI